MEPQKTPNSSIILRKNNKADNITLPDSIILQNDNNQNSIALAEKQTHRPVEQN